VWEASEGFRLGFDGLRGACLRLVYGRNRIGIGRGVGSRFLGVGNSRFLGGLGGRLSAIGNRRWIRLDRLDRFGGFERFCRFGILGKARLVGIGVRRVNFRKLGFVGHHYLARVGGDRSTKPKARSGRSAA
jgi:hypothetical protein